LGTFRNKVINHGALLQAEGSKLTIELNKSYPYQAEVLSILDKLSSEVKLRKVKRALRKVEYEAVLYTQKEVEILNDHVLFKMAEYIGITGLFDIISEKIDDAIELIYHCNSKIFLKNIKVQLIQDLR
jgi:hypothetical protein